MDPLTWRLDPGEVEVLERTRQRHDDGTGCRLCGPAGCPVDDLADALLAEHDQADTDAHR